MQVQRKALDTALKSVVGAVSRRPGIPALTGVKVEHSDGVLTLTTTDLEVTAQAKVEASLGAGFESILIPARLLASVVKATTDDVLTFESIDDGHVKVGKVTLRLLPVDDFPAIPMPQGKATFCATVGTFTDAFESAAVAASNDYARPVLTGVKLELDRRSLTFIGTDSYRLHVSEAEVFGLAEASVIVPPRAILAEAKRERTRCKRNPSLVLEVFIGTDDGIAGSVAVRFPNGVTVITRVIDGEYPSWRMLVPEPRDLVSDADGGILTFDHESMADAVKLMATITTDTTPVRFDLNGSVALKASSPDLGEAETDVEHARWGGVESVSAAFNPGYLLDALKSTGAELAEVRGALKPVVLRGEGRTALVMPVRMPATAA